MKTETKILFAFILNFAFSIFEFLGGFLTASVAIMSDAVHDFGDAISIGISYFFEKKSKKQPDEIYTYGYIRYSVVGSVITTLILLVGSVLVTYNAVIRLFNPVEINYNGMLVFAVVGVVVNLCAAIFTGGGGSLNQKAVNLHMLEDVLGWVVVLIGAVVMRFTDIAVIDSLMSIGVAVFIFIGAIRTLIKAVGVFFERIPQNVNVKEIKEHLVAIDGVENVHHIHIWSMDGCLNYATMHVVAKGDNRKIKAEIREELAEHGIGHVTLELEDENECCENENCHIEFDEHSSHHHHHHNGYD